MEKYVECVRDGMTLRGMMHIPMCAAKDNKVPMVIMFHGFTADRNEAFVHTFLSRRLCDEGIASVRFDFMGSGESDGQFKDMTLLTERADGEAILDFVKTLDFVNTDKILLHGMSQGGVVAILLAALRNEEICGLSLWSPALCIPDSIKRGEVLGTRFDGLKEDGVIDHNGLEIGYEYVKVALEIDIYGMAKTFKKPTQIVHGTSDEAVSHVYSQWLKEMMNDCQLILVPNATHMYTSLAHREARLQYAIDFIKAQ